ncbi:MAG TPA: ABC transporter permease [Egibacteraceae bacterium]|nr:ABC transporter permease [Egibacteraceae bacterium]
MLFAAAALNFALPRLAPGDVTDYLIPPEQAGAITAEQRERILARYGLDEPLPVQFREYLAGLVRGDLLISARYSRPVTDIVLERLPWTLLLVGTSTLLAVAVGTAAGFRSAWKRGRATDVSTMSTFMLIDSMPPFFVGLLLILVFSVHLGWFPIFGAVPTLPTEGVELVVEVARRLILPALSLTAAMLGTIYLVARPALVSELREDYVLMAQAKGLTKRQVRRHAERNALLPVTTMALINLGTVVGGATVIETVFSYPGLGRLLYESVLARDYPVLQGTFFVLAVTVLAANFVADLLYPLLDPRVRRPFASP